MTPKLYFPRTRSKFDWITLLGEKQTYTQTGGLRETNIQKQEVRQANAQTKRYRKKNMKMKKKSEETKRDYNKKPEVKTGKKKRETKAKWKGVKGRKKQISQRDRGKNDTGSQ